jgi:hypothetical protein
MDKSETRMVSLVLGAGIPFLSLVLFWWVGAGLVISDSISIRESDIPAIAITGLVFGIVIDAVYLKRWVPRIYDVNIRIIVPIYFFASLIMLAFFMGLPFGNLALGTFAGVYIGRRVKISGEGDASFAKRARRLSTIIAVVTAGEALPFALFSLNEPIVQRILGSIGVSSNLKSFGLAGVVIMILVIILVGFLQFWLTNKVARIAFGREKTTAGM